MSAAPEPRWYRYDASRRTLTLFLHVQPGAKASAVAGEHGDALKVRIAAPAVENKANAALAAFIAAALGVSPGSVSIRKGAQSRRKALQVRDVGPDAALALTAACNRSRENAG